MAYEGLPWQKMEIAFSAGLNQGTDVRARPQPFLDICRDVQFDEEGGLQTRLPYAGASGSIFGGGSIANARRIVAYGNELVLFTSDAIYSWNAQLSAWVLRGTHLAVKVDETPRFVTTGDQVDGDRAELAGTIVLAWTEGTQVYAAAMDKATGSVLVSPTAVSTAIGRPRLVALATKILLFVEATTTLLTVRAIDPATPATAIGGAGTTVLTTDFNLYYDVVRAGTQDLCVGACRRVTTTSYTAFTVTPALSVTTSTKARTADGPLAVATLADGTQTQVVRANGTNIQGDLLTTSTLADVFTGQAIGTVTATPVNQIAAAFTSTTCTAFWDSQETTDSGNAQFSTKFNTVTTGNVVGTQAIFVRRIGIASRAFERGGQVFVWLVWGEDSGAVVAGTPLGIRAQLQDTYFLYRSDKLVVSKAAWQTAGGYSPSIGHLPGVVATATDVYAWAGAVRRVISVGGDSGVGRTAFGARSPQDIAFAFDSNEARRCVQLGRTLYIAGGVVQQFDGVNAVELGSFVYPWAIAAQDSGVAGNVGVGTYNWKGTIRYVNGKGEQERSTTATGVQVAVAGASHIVLISYFPLYVTNKTVRVPSLEFWRTAVNAADGVPYYLDTGQDPNVTTGDNPYIPNDPTATGGIYNDNFADATLTTKEQNPENGGVLENLAPPGAAIIIATDTRLFLAGIPGDPHRVWYSKQRVDGQVAAFHEALVIDVPRPGGDITSIAFLDEVLFVFRQTAIYALPGQGLDNFGNGQQFGPARVVSLDIGAVNHESVAFTPQGLIFKSTKGWQLLHGNGAIEGIGDRVASFDGEVPLAVTVVEAQYQVRVLTASRMLVWDYRRNQWGEWTISDGVHACMFGGAHVYLAATGMRTQQSSYSGLTYGMDVETAWIKIANLQGATQCRRLQPLGEYRSSHLLRGRIAYNYDQPAGTPNYIDDKLWPPSPAVAGEPLQVALNPKRRRCQAIKLRLSAVGVATLATATDLTHAIPVLGGGSWTATLTSGAGVTLSIGVVLADDPAPFASIEVRDGQQWLGASWGVLAGNCGVLITANTLIARATVADLESAIRGTSRLVSVTTADASPSHAIDVNLANANSQGSFASTFPTGEALKLTALGLEVAAEPGLYNRLPAAQRR